MRAGRLPEIFCNEDIIVVGASSGIKIHSNWKLIDFAHKFPFTEIIKIQPLKKDKLLVYVYDATAKALAEKRYKDVSEYADVFEIHIFENDIDYINTSIVNHLDSPCKKDLDIREFLGGMNNENTLF